MNFPQTNSGQPWSEMAAEGRKICDLMMEGWSDDKLYCFIQETGQAMQECDPRKHAEGEPAMVIVGISRLLYMATFAGYVAAEELSRREERNKRIAAQ
jgi:hypothetical protein